MTTTADRNRADLKWSPDVAYTGVDAEMLRALLILEAAPSVDQHGIAVVRPYVRRGGVPA